MGMGNDSTTTPDRQSPSAEAIAMTRNAGVSISHSRRPTLLDSNAGLAGAIASILWEACQVSPPSEFLSASLPFLTPVLGADYLAICELREGHWQVLAEQGTKRELPTRLLSETLDREAVTTREDWLAATLYSRSSATETLVVHAPKPQGTPPPLATISDRPAALADLAGALGLGLVSSRGRSRDAGRAARLDQLLKAAWGWSQIHEMAPLLVAMAEAATRLLDADRASIFIWDRTHHQLVGRPALGIEGGELRIPDNAGVVGRVLQTGAPCRVDSRDGPRMIDRRVDVTTGYKTHTLLGVPLRGRKGELFGVFEAVNKRLGDFSDDDRETLEELAAQAAIALENTQERQSLLRARRLMTDEAAAGARLIGESPSIVALRSTIARVADTDLAVLLLGENGTGKEVVSQSIHYLSRRRDQPFVAVNCAAITETLLESELFGHEKGAFTDAHSARAGKFELASGGTLFLDEIGDLSPPGQAKLLRVLEEKVVVRVGGSTTIPVDTRIIAATNQDLAAMVREKRFRQDLYFRLNVVRLTLSPLRERREDISRLAEHFLEDFCRKARRPTPSFSAAARRQLERHDWPGNVRELRNLMERLAYLSSGDVVEIDDLGLPTPEGEVPAADISSEEASLAQATDRFQSELIRAAISQFGGNMSRAAARLGLHRSNLYRKMRQLGIPAEPESP